VNFNRALFKSYDIRGSNSDGLNEDLALWIGRVYGSILMRAGERTICVGRDGRLDGLQLSTAVSRGLVEVGLEVIDVDMLTTPMLFFAATELSRNGIQVTGSHSPKSYNGFKFSLAGKRFFGQDIQKLHDAIAQDSWVPRAGGTLRRFDVSPTYTERIVEDIHLHAPMKVVLDSGNGVAGASSPALFRALGAEVVDLFSEVDGNFPNHHPDPSQPENMKDLIAAMAVHQADLGIAFDGDGDRIGVVAPSGEIIEVDRFIQILLAGILRDRPGASVVYDVKCSQRLVAEIEACGGLPLMCRTGTPWISEKIAQTGAVIGLELAGHVWLGDRWYGFDDPTYVGARLLEALSLCKAAGLSSRKVFDELHRTLSTPELMVSCNEGEQHRVSLKLQEIANEVTFPSPAKISLVDGVRVDWPDGFGLIRASNTAPMLVLRFEGHNEAALHRIETTMMTLLKTVKPDAQVQTAEH
jgi:phosphomannomutase